MRWLALLVTMVGNVCCVARLARSSPVLGPTRCAAPWSITSSSVNPGCGARMVGSVRPVCKPRVHRMVEIQQTQLELLNELVVAQRK